MGILQLVVAIFLILLIYAARYKRVSPNQALIVFGKRYPSGAPGQGGPGFKVVRQGGKFIVPIVESFAYLSLEPFFIDDEIEQVVVDARGPKPEKARVHIRATAKVEDTPDGIRRAASGVLGKTQEDLRKIVAMALERRVREILGTGPVSLPDHEVATKVQTAARGDLAGLGLEIVTLVLTRRQS